MSTLDTLANAFEFKLLNQTGEWEYAMKISNLAKYIIENEEITLLELLKLYEKESKFVSISFEETKTETSALVYIYENNDFLALIRLEGVDVWSSWLNKYCSQ